jgi:3-oxoacyl-[acyl-carrier-protein] synthase-3
METESETLMREGIATGVATFQDFLAETGWNRYEIDRTFCHQVGVSHRKLMLEALELSADRDYSTVEWLGNTGAVALPITMAHALESGFAQSGDNVAMLGIGSGINCLMVAANWQESRVCSALDESEAAHRGAESPSAVEAT